MMTLARWIVLLAGAAAPPWFAWDAARAHREASRAREGLIEVDRLAGQVQERRAAHAAGVSSSDASSLLPALHAALLASSLPTQSLSSFAGDPADPDGTPQARATIEPITLAQLGGLLAHWRERHPEWTITTIELGLAGGRAPARTLPPGSAPVDVPSLLRAGLVLEPTLPARAPRHAQETAR